ncbi:MAG: hypothetical protein K2N81_13005, partial [Acetatifactor sp.]|nr:hypothetical protein [Acetatifactor sp.]
EGPPTGAVSERGPGLGGGDFLCNLHNSQALFITPFCAMCKKCRFLHKHIDIYLFFKKLCKAENLYKCLTSGAKHDKLFSIRFP